MFHNGKCMKILEKMGWTKYGKLDSIEISLDIVIISVGAVVVWLAWGYLNA